MVILLMLYTVIKNKAFGTVPNQRLMCKLALYGIKSNVYNWIEDFLSNKSQRVRVGKGWSIKADVLSGIPQGTVRGPILFKYNFYQ